MTQNIKPLIDQLKQTLSDKEQVRSALLKTRTTVETKAKDLLVQTRESRIVNQYVVPLLQSEKTEQAIQALSQKFAKVPMATKIDLAGKLEKYRKDLLDLAAPKAAAPAEASATAEVASAETAESSNTAAEAKNTDAEGAEKAPTKIKRTKPSSTETKA